MRARPGQPVGDILASEVAGQDALHAAYGGVVPEIAARAHAERLDTVTARRARRAPASASPTVDAVAVTAGPGLIGGVLAGVMFAKGIAAGRGLPLWGVNHLAGHALTPRLDRRRRLPLPHAPRLRRPLPVPRRPRPRALPPPRRHHRRRPRRGLRQGGEAPRPRPARRPRRRGRGRAPATPRRFAFPRPLLDRDGCDLSFSGLKTAVRRARDKLVEAQGGLTRADRADLCAGFQAAVADTLAEKTRRALAAFRADRRPSSPSPAASPPTRAIRAALAAVAAEAGAAFLAPPLALCTDNGAMIAWAAAERMAAGAPDGLALSARPRWPLDATAAPDARRRPQAGPRRDRASSAPAPSAPRSPSPRPPRAATSSLWGRDAAAMAAAEPPPRDPPPPRRPPARNASAAPPTSPRWRGAKAVLLVAPRPGDRALPRRRRRHLPPRPPRPLRQGHRRPQLPPASPRSPPPPLPRRPLAALTGPGFAAEIAARPAHRPHPRLRRPRPRPPSCRQALSTARLRLYLTDDVTGAELGGALKNVVAIACGIVDGARLGASARAALMTRGFAEMTRLAAAIGARPETLAGLSGLGDLSLTCNSPQSRNFALGRPSAPASPAPAAPSKGLRPPAPPVSLRRRTASSCRSPPPSPTCSTAPRRSRARWGAPRPPAPQRIGRPP